MNNPLLFVNFGSSSADTCFNDTFTDNYVSNCRILQYITTIRPDRPSHIIGWPPYLRHAEGAHPNMVSYRELGQNPETLVVYTRNHPQGQNSNYFLRLRRGYKLDQGQIHHLWIFFFLCWHSASEFRKWFPSRQRQIAEGKRNLPQT